MQASPIMKNYFPVIQDSVTEWINLSSWMYQLRISQRMLNNYTFLVPALRGYFWLPGSMELLADYPTGCVQNFLFFSDNFLINSLYFMLVHESANKDDSATLQRLITKRV